MLLKRIPARRCWQHSTAPHRHGTTGVSLRRDQTQFVKHWIDIKPGTSVKRLEHMAFFAHWAFIGGLFAQAWMLLMQELKAMKINGVMTMASKCMFATATRHKSGQPTNVWIKALPTTHLDAILFVWRP